MKSKISTHELMIMIKAGEYPLLESFPTSYISKMYDLKRLGTGYGGWQVPVNKIKKGSVCYCVGAGEDISFDVELVTKFGCEVFIFDPTPRAKAHFEYLENCVLTGKKAEVNSSAKRKVKDFYPVLTKDQLEKLRFFPYGIWSKLETKKFYVPKKSSYVSHSIVNIQHTKEYFEADCVTIKEMMQQLGHNTLEILKLDIEGAEYEVIDSILQDNIVIKILCFEFDRLHRPQDIHFLDKAEECIRKLILADFIPLFRSTTNFTLINKKEIE